MRDGFGIGLFLIQEFLQNRRYPINEQECKPYPAKGLFRQRTVADRAPVSHASREPFVSAGIRGLEFSECAGQSDSGDRRRPRHALRHPGGVHG